MDKETGKSSRDEAQSHAPTPQTAPETPPQTMSDTAPDLGPVLAPVLGPDPIGASASGYDDALVFSEVDGDNDGGDGADALRKLHPNYKLLMRFAALFAAFVIVIAALVAEAALSDNTQLPFGLVFGPAFLLAAFVAIRVPLSRYNARGYQISRDRLRVVRGVMFRSDTIVPFGRVQHIDVDQGPVERALGIATLEANWISLDDVARFMLASLERPDM
ncbi:MAG: PH domain-containing protein, partial [Erythrobacter sp.]|nr:PH domain-containing protein [Erythrobacter sp.]